MNRSEQYRAWEEEARKTQRRYREWAGARGLRPSSGSTRLCRLWGRRGGDLWHRGDWEDHSRAWLWRKGPQVVCFTSEPYSFYRETLEDLNALARARELVVIVTPPVEAKLWNPGATWLVEIWRQMPLQWSLRLYPRRIEVMPPNRIPSRGGPRIDWDAPDERRLQ